MHDYRVFSTSWNVFQTFPYLSKGSPTYITIGPFSVIPEGVPADIKSFSFERAYKASNPSLT